MIDSQFEEAIRKVTEDRRITLEIIQKPDSPEAASLLNMADRLREETMGKAVHLRGLIEFSNFCRNNCLYCGLRKDNRKLPRYRMSQAEIIESARAGAALGFRTIVLQSGEDLSFQAWDIAEIIREIKQLGLVVTLSLGEREPWEYALWRQSGAERYLMRHETALPELYQELHPGQNLQRRIYLLKMLKNLDYQVGTGFIVGLPGQTGEHFYADLLLLRELHPEMVGIGPLIPHPDTPLKETPGGTSRKTMVMLALARLNLPYALIPATTALSSIDPCGRENALRAGANVVMVNLTPARYRNAYQIYPNKADLAREPATCINHITRQIQSLGRQIASDPGHHPIWLQRRHSDVWK